MAEPAVPSLFVDGSWCGFAFNRNFMWRFSLEGYGLKLEGVASYCGL